MRPTPGTGLYADRLRFLSAVANEVPACLAELAELLTPARVALLESMTALGVEELGARPMAPAPAALPVEPWHWLPAPAELGTASTEGHSSCSGLAVDLAAMPPEVRRRLVADPAEVLRRVSETARAPRCSAPKLAEVPTEVAELNATAAAWADRWNLSRGEVGGWTLAVAGLTLQRWATYRARGLCEGPDAMRLSSFEAPAWVGYIGEREAFRPFSSAGGVRARVKTRQGAPVELLTSVRGWHLAALARWQVAGDGADRAGRRWAELERRKVAPHWNTVTETMRRLAERLELPSRPPGRPGRRPG